MRIDALRSLLKMRQATTEAAKISLSQAIAAETAANAKLADADRRIVEEAELALSLSADDRAVEAYARWLPQGRRDAAQARDLLSRATTDVSIARAALMMARAAEHAIQVELDAAEAAAAALRAKKAQFELDEIGTRLAASRANSGGS